jgi:hypothetical protein
VSNGEGERESEMGRAREGTGDSGSSEGVRVSFSDDGEPA